MRCSRQERKGCGRLTEQSLKQLEEAKGFVEIPRVCAACTWVAPEKRHARKHVTYPEWCPPGTMYVEGERHQR